MKITNKKCLCSRDGMTIQGLAFIPEMPAHSVRRHPAASNDKNASHLDTAPEDEKLPIAIVSHGFMANYKTTENYAKFLAEQGYAAFCFDFNGGCIHGKSDNDTTKMTVFTEKEDLKAVIAYTRKLPFVNKDDITLMGCSQGGFVSALVGAELRERITRLVLFYPALCIPDDARAGKMMFAKFDPQNIPEIIHCGPMKLGRAYAQSVLGIDAIEAIQSYEGPVLIVHGSKDEIVDCSYARKAAKAYTNAELVVIPDGKHGFSKEHDKIAMEAVGQFLK
ncbi:MAG: alpha/beta hydrolase [Lachnospiraceae bacterium]|nr:alpha/beta hydrolase [Lachnospiraceae bacterium]